MGFWSNFIGGQKNKANILDLKPTNGNISFFAYGNEIEWSRVDSSNIYKHIRNCAPLHAILKRKALTLANSNFTVNDERWQKLFLNPNKAQDYTSLMYDIYMEVNVSGFAVVGKKYATGFEEVPYELCVYDRGQLRIDDLAFSTNFIDPNKVLPNISVHDNIGNNITLNKNNAFIIFGTGDSWFETPLRHLEGQISLIESIVEAELTLIQNKGSIGILSNRNKDDSGHIPMTKQEKDLLQKEFSEYGLSRQKKQVIMTDSDVRYQSMVFPTKELQLQESYTKAVKDICEFLDYPFVLTAHSDNSTFNNMIVGEKMLYRTAIIPESTFISKAISKALGIDFNIKFDDVEVLKESTQEKGIGYQQMAQAYQILLDNNIISNAEWRLKMEELGMI